MRRVKDYLLLYLKGVAMGMADGVPGVSAGTIAFITGIYDELIYSIHSMDAVAVRFFLKFQWSDFWKKINGNFLVILLTGVLTSFFLLTSLMIYLLQHHQIKVWSFFFGLILIAAFLTLRKIRKWSAWIVIAILAGTGISYVITQLTPILTPSGTWFIIITGFVSGLVMLIPGISATYILLLFGKYSYLSGAFGQLRLGTIAAFMAGCIAGVISFSRILGYLLKNYPGATVALLAGFMMGSLNKVWPWREVLEYVTDREGQQVPVFDKSILPWNYFETTGKDPQVFQAILMMALGMFIVVLIEKIAARLKTKI